jgi:hypothetical protein
MVLKKYNRFGTEFIFDSDCAEKLDTLVERNSKGWDNVIIVTGMERGGKTTGIASPMATYLVGTKNFKIVFTPEEFDTEVDSAVPNIPKCILWDEFVTGGTSTDWYSKMQKTLKRKLVTAGKKKLYIILVIPSLFMLGKYFAVHRSISLVHCESSDLVTRDNYYWLGYQTKRMYYFKYKIYEGCSLNTMQRLAERDGNAICQFPEAKEWSGNNQGSVTFYPENLMFDEKEYQDRKDTLIASIGKEEEKKTKVTWVHKMLFRAIHYLKTKLKLNQKQIAELLIMDYDVYRKSDSMLSQMIMQEDAKKITENELNTIKKDI